MTEEEKKLQKEVKDLRNPSLILNDFCNRLIEKFDDNLMFKEPQEIVREAYDEEKKALIKRMKATIVGLTELLPDSQGLVDQANKLINPDDK